MKSQPGKETIAIHVMPNISRSKSNQTMLFGQLIEYNMKNIFLEKSYTKCGGKTIPRTFSKKSKLSISLDQQSKVLHSLLRVTSYKTFLKKKKRSETSLSASFFE